MTHIDRNAWGSLARLHRDTGIPETALSRLVREGKIRRLAVPAGRTLYSVTDAVRLLEATLNGTAPMTDEENHE